MANTELLRLISESHLHEEDTIEILRIFEILTDKRKTEIIDDWPKIAESIRVHREQMEEEKKILLGDVLQELESDLEAYNRELVRKNTGQGLKNLQTNI